MFRIIHITNDTTQREAIVLDTEILGGRELLNEYGDHEDDVIRQIFVVDEDGTSLPTDRRLSQ